MSLLKNFCQSAYIAYHSEYLSQIHLSTFSVANVGLQMRAIDGFTKEAVKTPSVFSLDLGCNAAVNPSQTVTVIAVRLPNAAAKSA